MAELADDVKVVNTDVTVSREPEHSTEPAQSKSDLYAEPFPTGDPVTNEAMGIEPA